MVEFTYKGWVLPNTMIEKAVVDAANITFLYVGQKTYDIAVLLTDDKGIKKINSEYRMIDKATDVLSFPSADDFFGDDGFFGDIAISLPTAKRQSRAYNQNLKREICFLTIHGCLHLLGYDHLNEQDEDKMRQAQRDILEQLKEKSE